MRKSVSLLMVGSLLLLSAGCAQTGSSVQSPAPVVAAPAEPERPGPLPAPAAKEDSRRLYPAYTFVDGARKWGYIDEAGQFGIQPMFDWAAEFEADGLAIVRQDAKDGLAVIRDLAKRGLVNKDGELIAPPIYDRITPANADFARVLFTGEAGQAVDTAGKLLFGAPLVSDNFGSGLAPYRNEDHRYGYVNRQGQVVIPAQYRRAPVFQDGRAVVQVGAGYCAVIDPAGNHLSEFDAVWANSMSENLIAFEDMVSQRWGYVSVSGEIVMPARFGVAGPFQDGLAVVSTSAPYTPGQRGVIDTRGEFVIPAQYQVLKPLGAGLFAAAKPAEYPVPPEEYLPMALLNREGRQLTDFQYYYVQPAVQGLISVSDGTQTFFLDAQGNPARGLPVVEGFGKLLPEGELIKAEVDDRVRYLRRDGQVVWQSDDTIALAGGLRVIERKHRANRASLVFYPEFAGLADSQAQEALNRTLRTEFLDGELGPPRHAPEEPTATTAFAFSVSPMKSLVVIYEDGFWYGWGAAHSMTARIYYHVDAQTGTIYTLADLFKPESKFTDRLREIIGRQIAARGWEGALDKNFAVRPDQSFYVSADALTIYYRPYEIASYAQGFVGFSIPWSETMDMVNTNGPFWKSFH